MKLQCLPTFRLTTSLLVLLTVLVSYGPSTVTSATLFVPRPADAKYTTIVTVDSGGMRGIIAVVGLVELENLIKTHILAKRKELLLQDDSIASVDDFEVSLADYVDCFSGVSASSWIVGYLASKGGNGFSANIFKEKRFIEEYGSIAPGSARGLFILFHEFGNTIYPQTEALPTVLPFGNTDPTQPGVVTPVFDEDDRESVLRAFVGDTTMSQLSTTCLIPAYEINIRSPIMFVLDKLHSPPRVGYAKHVHRNRARQLTSDFTTDLQFVEGPNFYLREVSTGSSAVPMSHAAKWIHSVNRNDTSFLVVDGAMTGGANPTLHALAYVMNTTNRVSFEDIAIISFGTGYSQGDYAYNQSGDPAQWNVSPERINEVMSRGIVLQALLDILFYSNPKVQSGQFLRVDTIHDESTEEGAVLRPIDQYVRLPILRRIGEELVESYKASLTSFVEKFIFA